MSNTSWEIQSAHSAFGAADLQHCNQTVFTFFGHCRSPLLHVDLFLAVLFGSYHRCRYSNHPLLCCLAATTAAATATSPPRYPFLSLLDVSRDSRRYCCKNSGQVNAMEIFRNMNGVRRIPGIDKRALKLISTARATQEWSVRTRSGPQALRSTRFHSVL